jgi:hypothetical protein
VEIAVTAHTKKYDIDPGIARLASSRSAWPSIAKRISGSRLLIPDDSFGSGASSIRV